MESAQKRAKIQAKKNAILAAKLKNCGFEDDKKAFQDLPLGVMMFSLEPLPLHPANKVWMNRTALNIFGYSDIELAVLNHSKLAFHL